MERVAIRHQTLVKTLKTLEKPLKKIKTDLDRDTYEMIRDSLIQRFEYSFEACWQLLKQLLDDKFSVQANGTSNIFRESLRMKLIDENELQIFLEMGRDRNQTSHTYKEGVAQAIADDIPLYFNTMSTVAKRLEKSM